MAAYDISEFDLFFLSYDEPNADLHYADLIEKAPWAERIHGVKGFDTAHRACANASNTDWFITIDADNIVRPDFFDLQIELDKDNTPNRCFSWDALNQLNGLRYGNGGVKLWSKNFVLNMNSHENATDTKKAVDFCWDDDYIQIYKTFSEVCITGSAYQAWKSGYREGVKLTLDRGDRVEPENMKKALHSVNLRNARIWACVGDDIPNGIWALYGTRQSWLSMCDMNWDHTGISDYNWLNDLWKTVIDTYGETAIKDIDRSPDVKKKVIDEIIFMGEQIFSKTKIHVPYLNSSQSIFFRETR